MSFDWSEYLKVAKELAKELVEEKTELASKEARFRSSVSRAYFAAHCIAANRLRARGVQIPRSGPAHQEVINWFLRHSEGTQKEIGENLARLRADRNKADYKDEITDNLDFMAVGALILAEQVVSALGTL